ncbi:glycosyltransferase family 9 protein [Aeromonas sp. MR16]|uniref:glycosyltransferase family 9 protein n=1 Tax=Aeromonas sp. MR16 TaxID=2923420 RepID=UPI001F4AFF5A|nr:glycosyltransferase family 9 protein [Aeromonas sp. MR16]MCH7373267.1 glycosyltransferase family 9 protein [Aeromonas sp. MR16]
MKYLVVQTKQIGDVLISTALCNNLKQNDTAGEVHYLVMDYCAGMAEGNPNIDKLIVIEKARRNEWGYMKALLLGIRRERYDVVINSQGQMIGLLTCLLSGAKLRIGFDSFPWRLGHNRIVRFRKDTQHQGNSTLVDDRFALLAPLKPAHEDRNYYLWLSEEEKRRGRDTLLTAGIDLARPLIAMGVNSLGHYKRWPIGCFAKVAQWLIEQHDAQILIYCGPGEEEYNRGLKPLLPTPLQASVFDQVQTRSVRELVGLFAHCQLFVGNDTGPRHIAQALDIPLLTIVSPLGHSAIANPVSHPRYQFIDTDHQDPEQEILNVQERLARLWGEVDSTHAEA